MKGRKHPITHRIREVTDSAHDYALQSHIKVELTQELIIVRITRNIPTIYRHEVRTDRSRDVELAKC